MLIQMKAENDIQIIQTAPGEDKESTYDHIAEDQ